MKFKKTVAFFALATFLGAMSCSSASAVSLSDQDAIHRQEAKAGRDELSLEEVHQIEKQMPLLKIGMSVKEVDDVLGLERFEDRIRAVGGGGRNYFWITYGLREGCTLTLVHDFTRKTSGEFRSARLTRR